MGKVATLLAKIGAGTAIDSLITAVRVVDRYTANIQCEHHVVRIDVEIQQDDAGRYSYVNSQVVLPPLVPRRDQCAESFDSADAALEAALREIAEPVLSAARQGLTPTETWFVPIRP
jgi:hypothetical protein